MKAISQLTLDRAIYDHGTWREGFGADNCLNLSNTNCNGLDFTKITQLGKDLARANLSGASLEGCKFKGVDLNEVNFTGANLTGAKLKNTRLADTNFTNAILTGAFMEGSASYDTSFRGARLEETDFSYAVFSNVDMTGAYVKGIQLHQLRLKSIPKGYPLIPFEAYLRYSNHPASPGEEILIYDAQEDKVYYYHHYSTSPLSELQNTLSRYYGESDPRIEFFMSQVPHIQEQFMQYKAQLIASH